MPISGGRSCLGPLSSSATRNVEEALLALVWPICCGKETFGCHVRNAGGQEPALQHSGSFQLA